MGKNFNKYIFFERERELYLQTPCLKQNHTESLKIKGLNRYPMQIVTDTKMLKGY